MSTLELGRGDPESIATTYDRAFEYRPEEDAVRVTYDGTDSRTMDFAEWATRRAAAAARAHVAEIVDRLAVDAAIAVRTERAVVDDGGSFDRAVPLAVVVARQRDEAAETASELTALLEAVPRVVTVTMLHDDREFTAEIPVACREERLLDDRDAPA